MKISVSILNSVDRISDTIKLNNTSCDYLHIDVMDGKFVPEVHFTIDEIKNIIFKSNKKIDIHLMVEDPVLYIKELVNYNIDYITIHYEINKNIDSIIDLIKKNNIGVGLSIKPNTDVSLIKDYLDKIDLVLIMSVEPGLGGQNLIESSLDKVRELNLLGSVIFTGVIENTYAYLSASDMFVFPSRYEGLGIVLIEAQANGLKCIASDRVPIEADATGNVRFLPLEDGKAWVNEMMNGKRDFSVVSDVGEKVKRAGYDIHEVAVELTEFYLSC